MFNKIKEFFSKKPETTTDASWPFPTSRPGDEPIFTPEPINATPIPLPPVIEPVVKKAPAVKTTAKTTKAAPKPPVATKPTTTTKRSPGRPSKKP
jgi:hypothetical protein